MGNRMKRIDRAYPPYEGEEPYLYLCFAEGDREAVFPLLSHLVERGCRIWYSTGATADVNELNRQQARMDRASLVVLYLTDRARNDTNVKNPVLYYQSRGKPVICIDTDDGDTELSVGLTAKTKHLDGRAGRSAEDVEAQLIRTEGFTQELIGEPPRKGSGKLKKIALALSAAALLLVGVMCYGITQLGWFLLPLPQTPEPPKAAPSATLSPTPTYTQEPTPTTTSTPTPTPSPAPTPTEIPDTVFFGEETLMSAVREVAGGLVITEETLANVTTIQLEVLPEDLSELEKLPALEKVIVPQGEAERALELLDKGITVVLSPEGEASP